MSSLEEKIIKLLKKSHIYFEREKTFQDLRKGKYRFDFYCPFSPQGKAVIEVQGQQHYQYIGKFYKSRQEFMAAQERDRRKISYCLANDIKLYCIPYWEIDNLESGNEIFQNKFLAKDKWKNDTDWINFSK